MSTLRWKLMLIKYLKVIQWILLDLLTTSLVRQEIISPELLQ